MTQQEIDAALCVWEHILETLRIHPNPWRALVEQVGAVELRSYAPDYGKWCLAVYDYCTKDDPLFFDAYAWDWEVVPAIMDHVVCGGVALSPDKLPNPAEVSHTIVAFFTAKEQKLSSWTVHD